MARDEAYLLDMLQFSQDAVDFTRDRTYEQFLSDRLLQSAVIRCVEVIGEAARRVSPAFADAHAEIPWRTIIGTRHRLAHDYSTIDLPTVWRIVTVHVPELILQLKPLIPPEQPPAPDGATP
jgi:uncharacterized protein with HEPN domain